MLNAVYKVAAYASENLKKWWLEDRISCWNGSVSGDICPFSCVGAVRNSDEIYQLGGRFSDLRRVGGLGDGLWAFLRTLAWICLPSWGTTSMIKQAWEMDLPFQNKNLRFTESRWTGQDHLWSAVTRGEASLPLGSQDLNLHRRLQNWWWNRYPPKLN